MLLLSLLLSKILLDTNLPDQIKKDFDCENYKEEINEDFLNPDEFFVISKEANIILKCKIKAMVTNSSIYLLSRKPITPTANK